MSKHTPTPWGAPFWPSWPEDQERARAAVNAFHSPDREIATEQISEGLFWEMRDMLHRVATTASQSVGDMRYGPDADWQLAGPVRAEVRTLLAKLEPQK